MRKRTICVIGLQPLVSARAGVSTLTFYTSFKKVLALLLTTDINYFSKMLNNLADPHVITGATMQRR